MTTRKNTMEDRADQWATDFAKQEQRKNVLMGIGAVLVIALISAAVIAYFAGAMGAIAW